MAKKIICCVTNDLNQDQRMHRICNSLHAHGYHVTLVGRKKKDSVPLSKQEFDQKRLFCFFERGKLFYIEYNLRLFFHLLFSSFHALNAVDLDTIIPITTAAKLKGKRSVFDAHEFFTDLPELAHRPRTRSIWKKIEHIFVPKIDLHYTVCDSIANFYKDRFDLNFGVIRNLPFLESQVSISESKRFWLYQGVLNKGRGLDALIKVAIKRRQHLVIAGKGDMEHELKALVKELNGEQFIEFKGFVFPSTLKQLTQKAKIAFNLLDGSNKNYYYSLANKFFDYIHAGIPQIGMDFPEYKSVNQRYRIALLIKDLSEEQIHQAIEQIEQINTYNELKSNCVTAKQALNWDKEKDKLISLYEQVLGLPWLA